MSTSNLCQKSSHVVRIGTSFKEEPFNVTDIDRPLSDLTQQFLTGVTFGENYSDPITTAVREYGEDNFYKSVADINTYFVREDLRAFVTDEDTPLLNQRIQSDYVFTPIEIAEYMREFGYTPTSLSNQTQTVSNKIPKELEAFYTKSFTSSSMGSFCGLLPNVFGAIGVFFTGLNAVADLVNKLKNFSLNFSLIALIDQLKSKILNVIDKSIEKVQNVIENVSMENVIKQTNKFANDVIGKEFARVKETAQSFFDGTAVDDFKSKIKALIDYAVGIFKNPTLEEIQYLMFRFCGFISQVEQGLDGLKQPVNDYVNVYNQSQAALAASSAYNTLQAIRAGAIRYDQDKREEGINTGIEVAKNNKTEWQEPVSSPEYENITKWNDGAGDSKIEFAMFDKYEWQGLDISVRSKLMRVQKEFGKPLVILKGRTNRPSPEDYEDVHDTGKAIDLRWAGYNVSTREKFIEIAIRNGFAGIGRYVDFVHINVGSRREWSNGLSPDDPYYQYSYDQDYEELYGEAKKAEDAQVMLDVYNGKYKDGDIVSFQGGQYRVTIYSEATDEFEAGYDLVPL